MDGSQKLPQRMLNPIRFHLKNGSDFSHLALGVAGWMRYVSGLDECGQSIDVRDPMSEQLKTITSQHGLNVSVVPALVSIEAIFGKDLFENSVFMDAVSKAYAHLIVTRISSGLGRDKLLLIFYSSKANGLGFSSARIV